MLHRVTTNPPVSRYRVIKYVAIGVTVLILALAATIATMIGPLQLAPPFQLSNGIHFVYDGMSTIAIVPIGQNRVLLVDSGMDDKAVNLRAELTKMGMNEQSVSAILFTHGHPDHIGGAKRFPHAERIALRSEADLIAGLTGAKGLVPRWFPVSPTGLKLDRFVQDGDTVTLGDAIVRVFAVPGHTQGSAAYLVNGVLFLGDAANATTSGKLRSAMWVFSDDLKLDEQSLRGLELRLRSEAGTIRAIAFGHSGVLEGGLKPLTDWAQDHPQ